MADSNNNTMDTGSTDFTGPVNDSNTDNEECLCAEDYADAPDDKSIIAEDLAALHNVIEEEFSEEFKVGMKYESYKDLRALLDVFANQYGFVIARDGQMFTCNRYGYTKKAKKKPGQPSPKKKRKVTNWMKVGCTFCVNFAYTELPTKQEAASGKKRTDAVHITAINARHGEKCKPSALQIEHCLRAAGKLLKKSSDALLYAIDLVNRSHVPPLLLRDMLAPLLPVGFVPSSQDLVNFRLWAKANATKIQNQAGALISFGIADVKNILAGKSVDYKDMVLSQPAVNDSSQILKEVMQHYLGSDEGTVLLGFLEQLKLRDDGFDYRTAYTPDGKLTGVVWQTSSMRAAFARYGEC
jgi:hypothetical protein